MILRSAESLKERYSAFGRGLIASYALTEASHGSDIRQLDTKPCRGGEYWILTAKNPSSRRDPAPRFSSFWRKRK